MGEASDAMVTLQFSLARLVGHCLFDGHVVPSARKFGYTNKSKGLREQFIRDAAAVFKLSHPIIWVSKEIPTVEFKSVAAVARLLEFTPSYSTEDLTSPVRIPSFIMKGSSKTVAAFLQTFWDDEGSVSFRYVHSKKSPIRFLVGACKHVRIRTQLVTLHRRLHIGVIDRANRGEIWISRYAEMNRFMKRVGFSEFALVGKGRWKGLPKQRVLKMALQTYLHAS